MSGTSSQQTWTASITALPSRLGDFCLPSAMIKLNLSNVEHGLLKRDPGLSCVTLFSQPRNKCISSFSFNFYVLPAVVLEIQRALCQQAKPHCLCSSKALNGNCFWERPGTLTWLYINFGNSQNSFFCFKLYFSEPSGLVTPCALYTFH